MHMQKHKLHQLSPTRRFVPVPRKKTKGKDKGNRMECSGIADVMELGVEYLLAGGFKEYVHQMVFDPALGWPLDGSNASAAGGNTASRAYDHSMTFDKEADLDTGDDQEPLGPELGALGGGTDFD